MRAGDVARDEAGTDEPARARAARLHRAVGAAQRAATRHAQIAGDAARDELRGVEAASMHARGQRGHERDDVGPGRPAVADGIAQRRRETRAEIVECEAAAAVLAREQARAHVALVVPRDDRAMRDERPGRRDGRRAADRCGEDEEGGAGHAGMVWEGCG